MPVEDVQMYSENRLTNPSAETGDVSGWTAENVSVASGGVVGSFCFKFGDNANMEQVISIPGQPTDYKVTGFFLPEEDHPEDDPDVYAWLEVVYEYGDGSIDELRFPCRDDTLSLL